MWQILWKILKAYSEFQHLFSSVTHASIPSSLGKEKCMTGKSGANTVCKLEAAKHMPKKECDPLLKQRCQIPGFKRYIYIYTFGHVLIMSQPSICTNGWWLWLICHLMRWGLKSPLLWALHSFIYYTAVKKTTIFYSLFENEKDSVLALLPMPSGPTRCVPVCSPASLLPWLSGRGNRITVHSWIRDTHLPLAAVGKPL